MVSSSGSENRIEQLPEGREIQTNLLSRIRQNIIRPGIRGKVIGIVLGATVLLALSSMLYIQTFLQAALAEQLDQKTISITRDVAARSVDPILTNNIFKLHQLAYDTLENNEDVIYVFFIDDAENILVHTFKEYFPPDLLEIEHTGGDRGYSLLKFQAEDGILRDLAVPVFPGPEQEITARVGVIDYSLQNTLAIATRELLLIALATFAALSVIAYFTTTLTAIKPLNSLLHSVEAVGRGDLSQQMTVKSGDEFSSLANAFQKMTQQLANAQLARDRLVKKIVYSQEEERQRISRELHDETGQMLSTMMISLSLLEKSKSLTEMKEQTADFRQILLQSLEQVRRLAWTLTPASLISLGLKAALESLINKYRDTPGLEIVFHFEEINSHRLPLEIESTVYRVIQEALTNIVRHARAEHVNIFVNRYENKILIAIEDDGIGFDLENVKDDCEQKTGMGLISIEERISLIGGKLKVEASPGKGTSFYICIPLPLQEGTHRAG